MNNKRHKARIRFFTALKARNPFIRLTTIGNDFMEQHLMKCNISKVLDQVLDNPIHYEVVKYFIRRLDDGINVHLENGTIHHIGRVLNRKGKVINYTYDGQVYRIQRDAIIHIFQENNITI